MESGGVDLAHAAALAGLAGMTPVRLAKLLDGLHPSTAWRSVGAGTHPGDPRRRFAAEARRTDVDEVADGYARAGVTVLVPGLTDYPAALVGDPGAPAVLFAAGDPSVLEGRPAVAIVGTRAATPYGCRVASELGDALAGEGVVVVSGLAKGIDGAAHAGVLRTLHDHPAPPVAVVGTGPDVVYPASNRALWNEVVARGVVLSESPLGTPARPRVFPARNRIIAALSDVVVVVECHLGGGALYTVEAAARRAIPVCAVPGSVHSRASAGTNSLLVDGCTPVRDADDVLVALSLARGTGRTEPARSDPGPQGPGRTSPRTCREQGGHDRGSGAVPPPPSAPPPPTTMTTAERAVWEAVDDSATTFETILVRAGLTIAETAEACESLVQRGALVSGAGWWHRR